MELGDALQFCSLVIYQLKAAFQGEAFTTILDFLGMFQKYHILGRFKSEKLKNVPLFFMHAGLKYGGSNC
jgi:hypothetical protein